MAGWTGSGRKRRRIAGDDGRKRIRTGRDDGPDPVRRVRVGGRTLYLYSSNVPPGRESQDPDDPYGCMPGGGDREAEMQVMRAGALGENGSRESRRIYRAVLARFPNHFAANCNMGADLQMSGRPRRSLKYFARAIKVWPESHLAYAGMGRALVDMGKYKTAIKVLDRALAIQPDDPFALESRRMAAKKLGRRRRRGRDPGRPAADAA